MIKSVLVTVALVALAAGCSGQTPAEPSGGTSKACARSGEILAIGEIPSSDQEKVTLTVRTARADCHGKKKISITSEEWMQAAQCDLGKIWDECKLERGEPGIRLPTDPAS